MSALLPRISIVTPSFNQRHFLEETMQSVLGQDYPDIEYVVIDGGSNDGSADLLRANSSRLAYWVSEPDGGQTEAINKGFRRTTGEILAWLNSDDVYCPGAFRRVADFFLQHPDLGAVVGDQETINASGQVLEVKKAVPVSYLQSLHSGCGVSQPATFFTRAAWTRAGELDATLRYQMDYEYFVRLLRTGTRFGLIPTPLARFRLHGSSKTVSQRDNSAWALERRAVHDRYWRCGVQGSPRELLRGTLSFAYRARMFLLRLALRGVAIPFQGVKARRRSFSSGIRN